MKYLILLITFLFLSACNQGDAPSKQWEMAVRGAYSAQLSKDGKNLLLGSIHHGGSFWQVDQFERLYNWNHEADKLTGVLSGAISDNGLYASTSDHRKIVLWSAKTGEAFWLWEAPADIRDMDLSDDGQFALLGLESYEGALFDIKNGGVKYRLSHDGIVQAVDMTADMTWAITGGDDSLVKIWDLSTGKEVHKWQLNNQIKAVAISKGGRYGFAASHRGMSHVWDLTSGSVVADFPKSRGHFQSARFSENGRELLTGNSAGQVQLWEVKTGLLKRTWHLSARNPWVSKNTQVLDVAFIGTYHFRAVGANGIVYHLE